MWFPRALKDLIAFSNVPEGLTYILLWKSFKNESFLNRRNSSVWKVIHNECKVPIQIIYDQIYKWLFVRSPVPKIFQFSDF